MLSVRLLGAFRIEVDGRAVPARAWRLRKAADLVKLVALAPGQRLHREQAMDLLWPDKDPDAAANNLYQAIHGARRAIGATALELRDGILSFPSFGDGADVSVEVDVTAFEDALRRADAGEIGAREDARALYRGDLLPDDRFEDWAVAPREALAAGHRRNLSELASLREREGDLEAALDCLRGLLAVDPTDEVAGRRVMQLEARAGRRGAAQQQYESLREALRRGLEVEPSEETTRLARDIVEGRLDPLGDRPSSTNLPVQFTSFVGREREIREVQRLLLATRLLTLVGTGGTGKTRLALEAAQASRGLYADGVWLVELAAIRREEEVVRAVADVFGVREAPGATLVDGVARHLGDRQLLLVLDNCEHLVDACAALCHRIARACPNARIIATSRQPLRAPAEVVFRVPSLPVADPDEPLPPSELARIDAVRLFADRAEAADASFTMTPENARELARLCFHLDGLPLAIELAASRVGTIPIDVLLDRLGERFDLLVGGSRLALTRQQTLRATIDWSYDLLAPEQQAVLRRLAVFSGRVSPEAAEAVCAPLGFTLGRLLSILGELVDQSLLVLDATSSPPRFRMLETVREYAYERLVAAGDRAEVEAAQMAWAVELASGAGGRLTGDRWADGFRDIGAEHDTLRAALDRAVRSRPDLAMILVERLWPFWLWDGDLVECRQWLDRALSAARPEASPVRGRALIGLAALIGRSGDPAEHGRVARLAVETFREVGDAAAICRALQFEGCAPWSADDVIASEAVFRESLAVATDSAYEAGRGAALNALAVVRFYAGDTPAAWALMTESIAAFEAATPDHPPTPQVLDLSEVVLPEPATGGERLVFQETFGSFRDVPPRVGASYARANRGVLARLSGNVDAAAADLETSLAEFRELGDERAIAHTIARLGNLAAQTGDEARARQMLLECLEIRRRLGDSRGVSLAQSNLGNLEAASGRFDRADDLLTEAAAAFSRRGDAWGLASTLANAASLALARGDPEGARSILEEALLASRSTGRPRWVAWRLRELAGVAMILGDTAAADARGGESESIFDRIAEGDVARRVAAGPLRPGKEGMRNLGVHSTMKGRQRR
jgi:predicted ATPase/DNA-binding SARP family transcriptional activator